MCLIGYPSHHFFQYFSFTPANTKKDETKLASDYDKDMKLAENIKAPKATPPKSK